MSVGRGGLTCALRLHARVLALLLRPEAVSVAVAAAVPEARALAAERVEVPHDAVVGARPRVALLRANSCDERTTGQIHILVCPPENNSLTSSTTGARQQWL